jgi:hypothetical protein
MIFRRSGSTVSEVWMQEGYDFNMDKSDAPTPRLDLIHFDHGLITYKDAKL